MRDRTPLQSIEREAADCRAAFKGVPIGAYVQHCHHEQWIEILTESAENRIAFILSNKPMQEQAARLRLFRPLPHADWQKADADWQKRFELHAKVCGCPWGPKTDIFGEAR